MTRVFRLMHNIISFVDARDDSIPPGEGRHSVEVMVSLPGEADGVKLDHEVFREPPVYHLFVELLIRSQCGDGTLHGTK